MYISDQILNRLRSHCVDTYPHECCGALIGTIKDGEKHVSDAVALRNAEPDSPERRFVIDPLELHKVERHARQNGLDIIGFYHSHPDSPARPSSTDLEWAWPVYSYVIASVVNGEIADVRSYQLDDSQEKRFVEEFISTI